MNLEPLLIRLTYDAQVPEVVVVRGLGRPHLRSVSQWVGLRDKPVALLDPQSGGYVGLETHLSTF